METRSVSVEDSAADELATGVSAAGWALVPRLLAPCACQDLISHFDDEVRFRSSVVMERHGFGKGLYRYFAYPLPPIVEHVRQQLYSTLSPVANAWSEALGSSVRYPTTLHEFLRRCHDSGQRAPTPLILRYGRGDYNCLHQDLYGETVFPLQATVLLSDGSSFDGGEFVLTEQRPRRQSRVEVVPLKQGDAVVFAVNERPVSGSHGVYRVRHRHGVSTIRSGTRLTLGIIFHDANVGETVS